MKTTSAGIIGGVLGGLAVTAVMALGRKVGLHETLAERSEDWMDDKLDAREHLGDAGVTAAEQASHLAASGAFGAGYAALRPWFNQMPTPVAGALYGAGLYATNIGAAAPAIGLTDGEWNEKPTVIAQRAAMHVLYGVTTAMATEAILDLD